MNAEERANYVVDQVWELRKRTIGDWVRAIAEQIKQAELEAYKAGSDFGRGILKDWRVAREESRAEGFNAGLEAAAKLADEFSSINRTTGQCNLAERLRGMKP